MNIMSGIRTAYVPLLVFHHLHQPAIHRLSLSLREVPKLSPKGVAQGLDGLDSKYCFFQALKSASGGY